MTKTQPIPAEILAAVSEALAHASAAAAAAAKMVNAAHDSPSVPGRRTAYTPGTQPVQTRPRRRPAVLRYGRIHFACPACHRPTTLLGSLRGQLVSCPRCFSAIRVPDPAKRVAAENLGRTLYPLLHPAQFSRVTDSRRLLPWLVGRLPSLPMVMALSGALLLLSGLGSVFPAALAWASHPSSGFAAPVASAPLLPGPRELTARTESALQGFLSASGAEAKSAWVTDPARVLPLMRDWYTRQPGGEPVQGAEIGEMTHGFHTRPGDLQPVTQVQVTLPGQDVPVTFVVEHRPEGPRLAWAQSVGYSPVDWTELLRQRLPAAPVTLRLLACRDDYFNYAFTREEDYLCLRLHDPRTHALLGFAYAPRTDALTASIEASLPPAGVEELVPVLLPVRSLESSEKTRQVEIAGPVQAGWQEPEGLQPPDSMPGPLLIDIPAGPRLAVAAIGL